MRWFFLFVLALNIVYIGWGLSGSSSEESSVPAMQKGIPAIVLLSELGKASKVNEVSSGQENSKKAGKKADKKPVVVASNKADQDQASPAKKNQCYTLGPFRELIDLRNFTRSIRNYVKSASFRSRDEREQTIFWVYIKPASNEKDAKALSKRLTHMKVKDHYIIKTGQQINGISLGHFKEKNRAYFHAASLKKLGFSPIVEPVFKDYTLYWLDYQVLPDKSIPGNVFKKHLTRKINHLQRQCS
jgi:hypothetical protein